MEGPLPAVGAASILGNVAIVERIGRTRSPLLEDQFPKACLLVEPPIQVDRVEPRDVDLVDDRGLRAEEMPSEDGVVRSADSDVHVQLRVPAHRDASMEAEEFMTFSERRFLVTVRPEEPDLEVLDHPDSPEDRATLDIVLPGRSFEARDEILAIRELEEDGGSILTRLHRLTVR